MLKILLPTDFSPNAWNAISYALNLFKEQQCTFYILHTYTPAFYRMDYLVGGPSFSAIPDYGVEISLAGLEKTMADIESQYPNPNHSFEILSAFNLLTDEINDMTREKGIDLVVMGTKGATGAKEIFLGTNTVYVIRNASVPVLAVPDNFNFRPVKKILFPTDYWTQYKKEELAQLKEVAAMCNAKVSVLHVKEEYDLSAKQEENKAHLSSILKDTPHDFEILKGALMPSAVIDYIDEHDHDLLVMMNRKHSFLERMMWKQNIDQISFHVQIPFMVIRDTAKIHS